MGWRPAAVVAALEERLALALRALKARLRGVDEPAPFRERLLGTAVEIQLAGVRVRVASLRDLMRMKRAAGRPKDRIELEILGALQEEIEAGEQESG
ncbi:MAG: hypothetical protein ABR599_07230 [Gemmatimonadota bacterium]